MIKTDKKIIKAAKKLTNSSLDDLQFNPESQELQIISNYHTVIRSEPLIISKDVFDMAMERLIKNGYFRKTKKFSGGYFFCVTDKIILYKEFWFDSFTQKFWCGFVSGIVVGIIANLISGYLPLILSTIIQLISNL